MWPYSTYAKSRKIAVLIIRTQYTEFWCSRGLNPRVLQYVTPKNVKIKNIKYENCTRCIVWTLHFVSHFKEKAQTMCNYKQSA
jgi:hypothetical protein